MSGRVTAALKAKAVTVLEREWLPAEEAIKSLGKSERSLQRLAAAGHLRWQLENGTRRRMYHAGDLERVKEEGIQTGREASAPRAAAATPLGVTTTRPGLAASSEVALFLRELVARVTAPRDTAPSVDVTEKLWLSLEESQALSGFSRNHLLRLCRAGRVAAIKDVGWRIRRQSLEKYSPKTTKARSTQK